MPQDLLPVGTGVVIGLLLGAIYILWWKWRYTRAVRRDAVQRSEAVTVGKVSEQLLPLVRDFPYSPKDARFLGSPVDFVIFDGLTEGRLERIVFLEVKTRQGALTSRERAIRDVVRARKVEWEELRVLHGQP